MNTSQVQSLIRALLYVSGPIGAYLVSRHYVTAEQMTAFADALIIVVGVAPPIIAFVWSMFRHSDTGKIAAVEAMPEVTKVVVKPVTPDTAAAAAAADPARPKISTS